MNILPMSPATARKNAVLAREAAERLDAEIKRLTAEADNARHAASSWSNAAMFLDESNPTAKDIEAAEWFIKDAKHYRPVYWSPDPRG